MLKAIPAHLYLLLMLIVFDDVNSQIQRQEEDVAENVLVPGEYPLTSTRCWLTPRGARVVDKMPRTDQEHQQHPIKHA